MSVLQTKLRRELWQLRSQALAIALVVAGGVAVCLMALVNYGSLIATQQQYYQDYRFGDVFASLKRAPGHVERALAALPGVEEAATRIEGGAKLAVDGMNEPITARMMSLPEGGRSGVNALHLRAGRLPDPARDNEVAVLAGFAETHQLVPGSSLEAVINGRWQVLRVVGVVESPEFVYLIPPGSLLPDYQRYGVLWLSRRAMAAAMDMTGAFNSVALRLDGSLSPQQVIEAVDRLLARYGSTGAYARADHPSHRFLTDELNQLKTMAVVFPVIFLSVAMFLLHVVVSRLIATQRDLIAVLKAFGYNNRTIAWHYGQLVLVIATLGVAIGCALGIWLGRGMGELYMEFYRFPSLLFRLDPRWVMAIAALVLAVTWLGSWRTIARAARLPPAEAMRPPVPERFQLGFVDRLLKLVRLSQPSRMILRQLSRHPGRTLLAVLGVAMATAVVMVGNFQFDSVTTMVHSQFSLAQRQDVTLSLTDPVNQAAINSLVRQPGIRYAEGRRSVAVELIHGHRRWRTALSGLPEAARLQRVLDRRSQPVSVPPGGVLLTDFLATKLAVETGDVLEVAVLDGRGRQLAVTVAGITSEYLGVGAYMALPAMNRLLGEGPVVDQVLLTLDPERAEDSYRLFRTMPGVMATNLRQAALDSFNDTLGKTFLTFTFFNGVLGSIIAFGVIYNTLRISLSEKSRELASLRVLGYGLGDVSHILLGELAVIILLGIPLGWLLGSGLALAMVTALQTELYRIPLVISSRTLALAALVVFLSALTSGWVAWRRLRRLDLVSALKTRE